VSKPHCKSSISTLGCSLKKVLEGLDFFWKQCIISEVTEKNVERNNDFGNPLECAHKQGIAQKACSPWVAETKIKILKAGFFNSFRV